MAEELGGVTGLYCESSNTHYRHVRGLRRMTSCTQKRFDDADVRNAYVVLPAPRLRKSRKKVAAAITTSATAYSAISLLYLHIINIPMHVIVICRATTDDVVRCRTEVDVRRRAVCERVSSKNVYVFLL